MNKKAKLNMERWRCLTVGCNPKLRAHNAQQHHEQTGHRVAKWPVRSAEGERKQRERNRDNPPPWGYSRYHDDDRGHSLSPEDMSMEATGWGGARGDD